MNMNEQTIHARMVAIERIPSWSLWWMPNPPTVAERIATAKALLESDIQDPKSLRT